MTIERVNPAELPRASGFSHAVVATGSRQVYLAGQAAQDGSGAIVGDGLIEQFDRAMGNLMVALRAAGGGPEHLVRMMVYCTDPGDYTARLPELGEVWRRHAGRLYPAMALIGVTRLFHPAALVEIDAIAVLP